MMDMTERMNLHRSGAANNLFLKFWEKQEGQVRVVVSSTKTTVGCTVETKQTGTGSGGALLI